MVFLCTKVPTLVGSPSSRKYNNIIKAVLATALLVIMFIFAASTGAYAAVGSHAAEMTPVGNPDTPLPEIKAKSGLVYSIDLDEIVYEKNIDKKCDPYSMTKLVTIWLAAQNLDPDQTVTISKKVAEEMNIGSTMYLCEGEKVTVRDLMYGAMLASGNDAACALAEAVSGDMDKFVVLMNKTVSDWGCTNTHFANPYGWKDKKHYTTARDMLTIAKVVLADETVREIAFAKKYKMGATNKWEARTFKHHIPLINRKDSGILGGKTGFWDKGDSSIVFEYEKKQLRAIVVVMKDGFYKRTKDELKMLDYAHKTLPGFRVAKKGENIGSAWVRCGAKTRVHTTVTNNIYAYPMGHKASSVEVHKNFKKNLTAPLKKGTKVGKYSVYVDGRLVADEPVYLMENVEKGWLPSAIYLSNTTTILLAIGLVLIGLFVLVRRKSN